MALVDQWDDIEAGLADDWSDARLRLTLAADEHASRADALLGPLAPWRQGREIRFFVVRRGTGVQAHAVRRSLGRLDRDRIRGELELVAAETAPAAAPAAPARSLAASWDAVLATLPPDWSDLYLEVALDSSDYVAPASLNMTPLNARREPGRSALRFRAARTYGYGGSPAMVRRCLERCDDDAIAGELHLLRVLSDTRPVGTQGPVWQIAGRTA